MHNVDPPNFILLEGDEFLNEYRFNTMTVTHYFCRRCGIFVYFHSRYEGENTYVVNVGCLEGIDPYELHPKVVKGKLF